MAAGVIRRGEGCAGASRATSAQDPGWTRPAPLE